MRETTKRRIGKVGKRGWVLKRDEWIRKGVGRRERGNCVHCFGHVTVMSLLCDSGVEYEIKWKETFVYARSLCWSRINLEFLTCSGNLNENMMCTTSSTKCKTSQCFWLYWQFFLSWRVITNSMLAAGCYCAKVLAWKCLPYAYVWVNNRWY